MAFVTTKTGRAQNIPIAAPLLRFIAEELPAPDDPVAPLFPRAHEMSSVSGGSVVESPVPWSTGEWASSFQGQTGPGFARDQWSALYVAAGDAWKIRLLTLTEYQPLPPKANPSSQ